MRVSALSVYGVFLSLALASRAPLPEQTPSSGSTPSTTSRPDTAATSTGPDDTQYNPLKAQNDVDVAIYYMRKGDPDASIPRLEEAIQLKPDFAKPRLMLGEIYEKKRDNQNAVKYYKEYLRVLPHAPDAKKIQEKIAKLSPQ